MTGTDICDLAYLILLERLERRTLADRQGLIARGIGEDLPTFEVEQEAFDLRLVNEPKSRADLSPAELEQLELREALGVA